VIEDAGYGKEFFHRLGHGIGIDVHEPPFLAQGDPGVVAAKMCFTVEPSVWIPDRCFIRVEDVVVAAPGGGYSLNQAPRSLRVI
jgi:Xaa-Pro aminopeptidase